jgi:hypothetical protein
VGRRLRGARGNRAGRQGKRKWFLR